MTHVTPKEGKHDVIAGGPAALGKMRN